MEDSRHVAGWLLDIALCCTVSGLTKMTRWANYPGNLFCLLGYGRCVPEYSVKFTLPMSHHATPYRQDRGQEFRASPTSLTLTQGRNISTSAHRRHGPPASTAFLDALILCDNFLSPYRSRTGTYSIHRIVWRCFI